MDTDQQLSALLKTWNPALPQAGFERRVMDRLQSMQRSPWRTAFTALQARCTVRLVPWEPAAALAGIAAGLILAVRTLPSTDDVPASRFSILHPAGLAGSYMQVIARGGP